jgi:uncharacterized membrane protein
MEFLILLGVLWVICIYFAPLAIALHEGNPNAAAIGVVNVFLGWTLVGWVGALAWALTYRRRMPSGDRYDLPSPPKQTPDPYDQL